MILTYRLWREENFRQSVDGRDTIRALKVKEGYFLFDRFPVAVFNVQKSETCDSVIRGTVVINKQWQQQPKMLGVELAGRVGKAVFFRVVAITAKAFGMLGGLLYLAQKIGI